MFLQVPLVPLCLLVLVLELSKVLVLVIDFSPSTTCVAVLLRLAVQTPIISFLDMLRQLISIHIMCCDKRAEMIGKLVTHNDDVAICMTDQAQPNLNCSICVHFRNVAGCDAFNIF
eukprot:763507-Hanusia_phi.AAC.3